MLLGCAAAGALAVAAVGPAKAPQPDPSAGAQQGSALTGVHFAQAAVGSRTGTAAVVGTTWQLVAVVKGERRTAARPNLDATLEFSREGNFRLDTCNLLWGSVSLIPSRAVFGNQYQARRHCAGVAGYVDRAAHTVLRGLADWSLDDRGLHVRSPDRDLALQFREAGTDQPPVDARELGTLDTAKANCRLLIADTADGSRLYLLARTRAGGPWRLLPGGPIAPGDNPALHPSLAGHGQRSGSQSRGVWTCTAGFAPAQTATVAYRAPGRAPVPLRVHRWANAVVYLGPVHRVPDGRITAYDRQGVARAQWSTAP